MVPTVSQQGTTKKMNEAKPNAESLPVKGSKKAPKADLATSQVKARVLIDVDEGWAEIWFKGKKLGDTPKQVLLPIGVQTVILKNPETAQSKRLSITVKKTNNAAVRVLF